MIRCPHCGSPLVAELLPGGTARLYCPFPGTVDGFSGYTEPPCRYERYNLVSNATDDSQPLIVEDKPCATAPASTAADSAS